MIIEIDTDQIILAAAQILLNQKKEKAKTHSPLITKKVDLSDMITKWPSDIVMRKDVKKFTGGLLAPGTMANLACQGKGPAYFRQGKKVCYRTRDFVEWLEKETNGES